MDVLHVVHGYSPARGGVEALMQGISETLVSRYRDRVSVLTPNGFNAEAFVDPGQPLLPAGEEELNGVHVRRLGVVNRFGPLLYHLQRAGYHLGLPGNERLRTWYQGPVLPGLSAAIRSSSAEVVAAASFPLLHMFTALRACRAVGKPIVFVGALHPLDEWGFQRRMIYEAIEASDAYIALSTFERDYLLGRGIPERKIAVIGVGIDPEPYRKAEGRAVRERYGIGDRPLVGFIGQQTAGKGIDVLLLAMRQVWASSPETRLLLAGARTSFTPTLTHIVQRKLTPSERARVSYLHGFDDSEKPALFAACDVFAYPSWYESFGIAFLEAWSAGKPVVGTFAGAVPSIVSHGEDGLLVPPRDPVSLGLVLRRLLESPRLRERLGAAGQRKVVQRYRWELVTERWREIYAKVCGRTCRT